MTAWLLVMDGDSRVQPSTERAALDDQGGSRDEAAALWADRIWGERQGWAIGGRGVNGHWVGGSYKFSTIEHVHGRWPDERDALLTRLVSAGEADDVFVAPLLRDSPNRRAADSRALRGSVLWMDADPWDAQHDDALANLPVVFKVASGSPGCMHVYIDLGEEMEAGQIVAHNRSLKRRFRVDDPGGDNKLLRLPGTQNHKGRAKGGSSAPVCW